MIPLVATNGVVFLILYCRTVEDGQPAMMPMPLSIDVFMMARCLRLKPIKPAGEVDTAASSTAKALIPEHLGYHFILYLLECFSSVLGDSVVIAFLSFHSPPRVER